MRRKGKKRWVAFILAFALSFISLSISNVVYATTESDSEADLQDEEEVDYQYDEATKQGDNSEVPDESIGSSDETTEGVAEEDQL